ncbi:hypothetical protein BP6252_00593 [Coleophoma cylindrospora]|uniref:Alpha-L-rhamnosidase six-hairpin glycosidase domain-containing protein n=1 Tax=Coleophoma cylindrospora TaxID=1849047 RepID=A0A3D8SQV3_9HELO|nr:hypothetical protein BP6252_00593 [Coleophoma cylindrospora]
MLKKHAVAIVLLVSLTQALSGPLNFESLPLDTLFPGPWESNIKAPFNKSYIEPVKVFNTEGSVSKSSVLLAGSDDRRSLTLGPGDLVSLEFAENIAGRVCFEVEDYKNEPFIALAYSESPAFVGREPDATTDRIERDLPLHFSIKHNGTNCLGQQYNRGGFKYLTIYMPDDVPTGRAFWHTGMSAPKRGLRHTLNSWAGQAQKLLGFSSTANNRPGVSITALWVNCTAFPSNPNGRAYTGYFDSSSSLLNRIWYAGAWTLQLSTIDPKEGSALIDLNRRWDENQSPTGSWYSNFTISNGTAVTTDGGKRDRMVWPGDMSIAVPGIAVSTYDMLAVRNALDTLFDHQYGDGSLPYAGPPMGTGEFSDTYHIHTLLGVYNYVLYSGDVEWLKRHWADYTTALEISMAKVDEFGLLHVSSTADWLRPGMTGHNVEASALLYDALSKSPMLADLVGDFSNRESWTSMQRILEHGIERLWCEDSGLFADNKGRRGCNGSEEVLPQDGNSWALLSHIINDDRNLKISRNLRERWGKYGAPATEFPNVISPFAGSFELLAHCSAGNYDAAVELMELQWGYMLDGPAFTNSTCAEGYRVDGDVQYPAYWSAARNSHAHGWSTGPTTVLMQEILGIKLTSPLGKTWSIKPQLTKWLSYAQGGFATRLGKFEVGISLVRQSSTGLKIEVIRISTPKDTTGRIEWKGHIMENVHGGHEVQFWRYKDDLDGSVWNVGNEAVLKDLIADDEWIKPPIEEREPGVVNWEALERHLGRSTYRRQQ